MDLPSLIHRHLFIWATLPAREHFAPNIVDLDSEGKSSVKR